MRIRLRRRRFNQIVVVTAFATAIAQFTRRVLAQVTSSPVVQQSITPTAELRTNLQINGELHNLEIEPRVTLLDALREYLGLTGTKKGCNHGQCGACTVLVNGRRINACLTFAVMHEGDEITTIEGLANGDELHPMQAAFIQHDGFQCGYCTPGQICSAIAMLEEVAEGTASVVTANIATIDIELTEAEICERMSGNLCRCGAYRGIVAAIQDVYRAHA